MDAALRWLESTKFSIWTRESTSIFAFPAFLSVHAIGMALAAGVSGAIALHVLGVGPAIPSGGLRRFLPVFWIGFWLNLASGLVLLVAYPTKALTNPVFYVKLTLIAIAMGCAVAIDRRVLRHGSLRRPRLVAAVTLVSWAGAITAGRLLAYTYHRLFVDF